METENAQKMEERIEFVGKATSTLTEELKNIRNKHMKHEEYASSTSANMTDTMQQTRNANQLLDEEISSLGRAVEQGKTGDRKKERDDLENHIISAKKLLNIRRNATVMNAFLQKQLQEIGDSVQFKQNEKMRRQVEELSSGINGLEDIRQSEQELAQARIHFHNTSGKQQQLQEWKAAALRKQVEEAQTKLVNLQNFAKS